VRSTACDRFRRAEARWRRVRAVFRTQQADDLPPSRGSIDSDALPLAGDLHIGVHTIGVLVEVQDAVAALIEGAVRLLDEAFDLELPNLGEPGLEDQQRRPRRACHDIRRYNCGPQFRARCGHASSADHARARADHVTPPRTRAQNNGGRAASG
jgi:hypothetical protein